MEKVCLSFDKIHVLYFSLFVSNCHTIIRYYASQCVCVDQSNFEYENGRFLKPVRRSIKTRIIKSSYLFLLDLQFSHLQRFTMYFYNNAAKLNIDLLSVLGNLNINVLS